VHIEVLIRRLGALEKKVETFENENAFLKEPLSKYENPTLFTKGCSAKNNIFLHSASLKMCPRIIMHRTMPSAMLR